MLEVLDGLLIDELGELVQELSRDDLSLVELSMFSFLLFLLDKRLETNIEFHLMKKV